MSAPTVSIHLNGQPHPITPGQTVADLVAALALTGKRIAVERNGEIVPRASHAQTVLSAGDRLEIVVAVGGG
ncbi:MULTISPECIES: sulfur carrier protein ThiS [Methyloversatilis]|uniref:sulfur carrier protein ThiS n=1 Tax=Methyloversatilis TaxID=378210 RepID=UPI0031153D27